jgi:hypothetical protein
MKDRKLIKKIRLEPGAKHDLNTIEVEMFYHKGGMNVWTGNEDTRGIYVAVTPTIDNSGSSYSMKTTVIGLGLKKLLSEKRRFNQPTFDKFVVDEGLIERMVEKVCQQINGKVASRQPEEGGSHE